MAIKKASKPAASEPVNSAQLEGLEAQGGEDNTQGAAAPPAAGPDLGELEERTVEAEDRATAAELRADALEGEMKELKAQIAQLMRSQRRSSVPVRAMDVADTTPVHAGEVPVFDFDRPYGLVVGDHDAAYVQDGHQFGRDKRFLRTEAHAGSPRAFNPKLVGWVKPRPNAVDVLEGLRDQ